MYLDETMELFVLRKILKIYFKIKDKESDPIIMKIINLFIKEIKLEIDETYVKAKIRKTERKPKLKVVNN